MRTAGLLLAWMLAACSAAEPQPDAAPDAAEAASAVVPAPVAKTTPIDAAAKITLAPDGLLLDDELLGFGTPRAQADAKIAASLGAATAQGRTPDCSVGPVDYSHYADDLQLSYRNGRFVGWSAGNNTVKFKTAKGVGTGTTRQDLEAAYKVDIADDALGTLFAGGGFTGVLDSEHPGAPIITIWAGTICLID